MRAHLLAVLVSSGEHTTHVLPKVNKCGTPWGRPFEEAPRIGQTGPISEAVHMATFGTSAITRKTEAEKATASFSGFNPRLSKVM